MKDFEPTTGMTVRTDGELTSAIAAMTSMLRVVENGDLSARVDVRYADSDPIGALAVCINTMVSFLDARRDETLVIQQELEGQIDTIEKQRIAIRELSTPIIEIWSGVLCAPIVGVLDSSRASEMTNALLRTVVETKSSLAIIDITGIEAMDTQAIDHFLRMARAVKLLGSDCALSGIHPNVAQTIVHMGVDLSGVESYRTLREALQCHVRKKAQQQQQKANGKSRTVTKERSAP
jgi:rsbT co-antagonist protein RsbR